MLEKYFSPDEIDKLVEIGPEKVREIYRKEGACHCADCRDKRRNVTKHLEHDFYKKSNDYREQERIGQIVKGAEKYPEPFNPASWTAKELLQHAMQENIDQGHYIYGLFEKIEAMKNRAIALASALEAANAQAEYWRLRAVANAENIEKINKTEINVNVNSAKAGTEKLFNQIRKAIEGGEING